MTHGDLYDYAPVSKREVDGVSVIDRHVLGRYRVIGRAAAAHTGQTQVVYEGGGVRAEGVWFCCSLKDSECNFVPAEPVTVAQAEARERAVVAKVAGRKATGLGV